MIKKIKEFVNKIKEKIRNHKEQIAEALTVIVASGCIVGACAVVNHQAYESGVNHGIDWALSIPYCADTPVVEANPLC